MKKFFKTIFGRLAIIGLAIVLQFFIIYLIISFLNEKLWLFQLLNGILGLTVFFNLVRRDMYPDSKLPWLFVILALPLFGTVTYLMFASNSMPRKQRKTLAKIEMQYKKHSVVSKARVLDDPYKGQSEYITKTSGLPSYDKCECDYYPSGESFWDALKIELSKAEQFIFMEYFIIERGVMWNEILEILIDKVKQGVEVRVMYDDIGCIGKIPANYHKKLRKQGIKCVKFNTFHPIVSGVHNNRDHRKITVIDGKVGFIGGVNIADEYINVTHPFGHWKDSAVRLKGEIIKSLTFMFLTSYQVQTGVVEDCDKYILEEYEKYESEGFVQAYGDGPAPAYAHHIGENVYINLINSAQRYLYITTPYLIIDHEMQTAIRSAALRGVDVRIITPHIPDKKLVFNITRSNYKPLMDCGVKIYEYTQGFVHAKNFLADDEVGVVGTINLDYRSLTHHYECAVWMNKVRALETLKGDFENTFDKCMLQDETTIKMGAMKRFACSIMSIFTPLL
ncbi:MAG: cardiolipin synthase [Clostridia bacterium]|nr:cardiolipin synthase [Clostridia bacterium]